MFDRIIRPRKDFFKDFIKRGMLRSKIEKIVKNKKLSDDRKVELIMREIEKPDIFDIAVY